MRSTVIGGVVGLGLGLLAGWLWFGGPDEESDVSRAERPDAELAPVTPEPSAPPELRTAAPAAGQPDAETPREPFPPHEFVIAVGQAYSFGSAQVQAGDGPEDTFDVLCQDIRHGAILRAPHGAHDIAMPLYVPSKSLIKSAPLYAAITSAPLDLPQRDASLYPRANSKQTNLALVKGRDGTVYKLRVLSVHGDPRVWKRTARIRYEAVPQVAGGGLVDLGPPPATAKISAAEADFLNAVGRAGRVKNDNFTNWIPAGDDFVSLRDLPPELEIQERSNIVLPDRLDTTIKTARRAAIAASAGIGPHGKIHVDAYTGIAVGGDMEGEIKLDSYGYVHITGDLVGTLDCDSYTTVRIDGDIRGTLKVRSYVTMYLRGRFVEPATGLDCKGSCWSTFFLEGHYDERELAALPATHQITLHIRTSDLEVGKHKVEPWREVIVGDPFWKRLR